MSPGTPRANLAPIPRPSIREFCAWMLGRRIRYRVSGSSMTPTLNPGDFILAVPSSRGGCDDLQVGDVVVGSHPFQKRTIVKRVGARMDGRVELVGDNPASSHDSRGFGSVDIERLLGRVTAKL